MEGMVWTLRLVRVSREGINIKLRCAVSRDGWATSIPGSATTCQRAPAGTVPALLYTTGAFHQLYRRSSAAR